MTEKRKRAGSDAAASGHSESDASDDEQFVSTDQPRAEQSATQQNKALLPFGDGAELYEALKTPSADLLRLLLSRLRHQSTLTFAENTQRSTIPASDKRIQLVKDYCQLCEAQASNSTPSTSAAASVFSTWELADRQDLPTLLHLPIFCLAQSLALLSVHYPTHALGSNIIERILSSNQPWLGMLHNYISNLGGAKFAASKQRDTRSSKGSDVAGLASLVLLREITSFAKGRYAAKLFDSFNWSMKVLPHIFNMRRRTSRKSKTSKKTQVAKDVSLRRPDIRTLYILFLLSFLQQGYSHTLKLRLLDLGRDFLPAILKGLPQDPPDVVQTILLHLHEDLVKDTKIPRSKKVEFWNEWACGCVVQLYSREDEHVLIHADTQAVENPSVAELAHHFLLSICTNPGFGICYPDRGWYPRKATATSETLVTANETKANDGADFVTESNATQKGKQIASGSIYNKVLSGVIRQLAVAEDLRQQELALGILKACPELVGPYLETSCAGLSVDPRPSSRWLCNVAFFGRVVGLELPSFRIAKVEHLETQHDSASAALTPHSHRAFAAQPPPMSSIVANILPGPFYRSLFSQGLNNADQLVQYSTCALLSRCLDRMVRFRQVCTSAISDLDEDENGPWRRRLEALELEARRRIPDISVVIQILQVVTSRPSVKGKSNEASADVTLGSADSTPVSEKDRMISTEAALRLLSLYYQAVPSSAFDARFNAGKLLTNAFVHSSEVASIEGPDEDTNMLDDTEDGSKKAVDGTTSDNTEDEEDAEDAGEIDLQALCQVHTLRILSHSARVSSFDWTVKPSGSNENLSYLALLLTLFVSTPLDQVKQACEELLRSLLSTSSFFEHQPSELDAWLASLPQSDVESARREDGDRPDDSGSRPANRTLSTEQSSVVAFLDECILRCAKTPYRYIEAARQYLQEHSRDADGADGQVGSTKTSTDVLGSPWLMAVFEQFTIRIEKGLFAADDGTVNALVAFLIRLLPVLCAYTRQTFAFEAMALKIERGVKANPKYASSVFLASVLSSKIRCLSKAPVADTRATEKAMQSNSQSTAVFLGTSTPEQLRFKLRNATRPLRQAHIVDLFRVTQQLHDSGFAQASQIFEELDPSTENIAAAAFPGAKEIAYGSMPMLHLPLSSRFIAPARDDFMTTTDADDGSIPDGLVPWSSNVHSRLAVWIALLRSQGEEDGEITLSHVRSLLSLVDAADYLSQEDARQFLFVEAFPAIQSTTRQNAVAAGLLHSISELAIKHLDTSRKEHVEMVSSLLSQFRPSMTFNGNFLRTMANLAPFLADDRVDEAVEACTRVLASHKAAADVRLTAAETLSILTASVKPSSRLWAKLILRLPELVEAAFRAEDIAVSPDERDSVDAVSVRQSLLLGVIQTVLRQSHDHATATQLQTLTNVDFSCLAQTRIVSPALDGALAAAIHAHSALALSVSEGLRSILEAKDPSQTGVLQAVPCSLLTLLSALLEHDSPVLVKSKWSPAHVEIIADLAISAILDDEVSTETAQTNAFSLVASLRCAQKFGWKEMQAEVGYKLLDFATNCVQTLPSKAFHGPLFEALLGLIDEVPALPRLSEILQATIDASLLWLVRRFAEDSNDSSDLVQTTVSLTSLIERACDHQQLRIQLKRSLVDPVIQAAIKNRLVALDQMRLVLTLCSRADLEPTQLSRYLGALTAHADFNSVMRGSAAVLQPLQQGEDADDERCGDLPEEDKREAADQLRQLATEFPYTVASRNARELLRAPLLTRLMAFYNATLSKSDRMILALFRLFEEECGQSFMGVVQGWTLPASSSDGSDSVMGGGQSTLEALQSLDANVVFATCTEYPRSLSLRNNDGYGYDDETDGARLPGQVYGKHTDAAQRYDPVFVHSLLAGVTAPGVKLSGLQWVSVFATNAPGLAVCGLSSRCRDMRRASLTLISSLYLAAREADFQEKDHLQMVLDLLRDALDSSIAIQDSALSESTVVPSDAPYLPTTTTLFIAHALRSVTTPGSFIYPVISHFLLQRPELDVGDVPLLYNLLYSASDKYKQERMWMLRFLRDVARSGGRSDWKIFKRRRTWDLLASLYDACDGGLTGAGMDSDRAVEETSMRALIEDTTAWLVRNADVAIELVTRRGLLTWIWQQAVREGVVALAEHHSSDGPRLSEVTSAEASALSTLTLRSVWILLLAQLTRSIDLDRLHRATDSAWLAPIITLTSTTIRALHKCAASTNSRNLPAVSADLVRTISYAATSTMEKVLLFADDPAMGLWTRQMVEALDMMMDLADKAMEVKKDDKVWERCCVGVQRCALALAAASTSADGQTRVTSPEEQKKLARLIRRTTTVCRRLDSETSQLVLGNLFSASA
ncbi:hypothetical protein PHSY_001230 [Pseudozyma hubeiensis SY62]|uniref:Uncharacterized protein n=1 Tax=Pseudozyma hubeiensis (strain SY62) TaxID=1305764 RepID=R9P6D0_PSEHS|nr:hypothetical protein PHSY_001230 [Pseudozyma hubeiensis SY62]GAC93665.1 hypothetical protein PHSY_001230 [Pseudozyma hubeiensis SY62]